ncbi:MAG: addiction module protein [Planctomycetes bacterium]|nr:addiction module protein [Planctomycetota bacterium]
MTENPVELLNEALKLTRSERALLVAELAASLDTSESSPTETDPNWLAEIERRIRRVQEGRAKGSDWESVEERIRERLRVRHA